MFWSGADFEEASLNVVGKKFKDASDFYNSAAGVNKADVRRWLKKAQIIQWDYQNIARNRGLERLKQSMRACRLRHHIGCAHQA